MPLTVAQSTPTRLAAASSLDFNLPGGRYLPPHRANWKASTVLFAAEGGSGGGGFSTLLLLGLMIVGFYFLLLRPQQKRRREMQSMQESMSPGDEVITLGGLYGTIEATDDRDVLLEIAPGVTVRYSRAGIGNVINKAGMAEPTDEQETDTGEDDTAAGKTAST